ncbi:hypothetical protein ACIOKD_20155 [Streptomyces sp. NPDC087844]|uniref:hypothetical protein n=1 Tax=Streptomyces sp. NPDC087844 TaxID=3365805 RepID=UPI0037FBFFFD
MKRDSGRIARDVKKVLSTATGKVAFALMSFALLLFLSGVVWSLVTDNEQDLDLATGLRRAGALVGAIGFYFAVQHHRSVPKRKDQRDS